MGSEDWGEKVRDSFGWILGRCKWRSGRGRRKMEREARREVIELADRDVLDVRRSGVIEQEVVDLLDELRPGEVWLADLGLAEGIGGSKPN